MRWAIGLCWVWFVPLAVVALVTAYLSLVFASFAAEGLGGEVWPAAGALALGLPALSLLLAAGAGWGTAFVLARWTSRRLALAALRPWVIGVVAAGVGGAAATCLFWAVMTEVGNRVSS